MMPSLQALSGAQTPFMTGRCYAVIGEGQMLHQGATDRAVCAVRTMNQRLA